MLPLLIPPRMCLSAKSAGGEQPIERFAEKGIGDVKMLAGAERQYRLRAGDWRIRFLAEPADIIRILHIRHRREAYR
jgi:mRNA-degrading endonuclease RelE of RelBE toxin-antitoxin system